MELSPSPGSNKILSKKGSLRSLFLLNRCSQIIDSLRFSFGSSDFPQFRQQFRFFCRDLLSFTLSHFFQYLLSRQWFCKIISLNHIYLTPFQNFHLLSGLYAFRYNLISTAMQDLNHTLIKCSSSRVYSDITQK